MAGWNPVEQRWQGAPAAFGADQDCLAALAFVSIVLVQELIICHGMLARRAFLRGFSTLMEISTVAASPHNFLTPREDGSFFNVLEQSTIPAFMPFFDRGY